MAIKLLIDGDILIYRSGFAVQKKGQEIEPVSHAIYLMKSAITSMCQRFKTDNYIIFLTASDRSNFRYEVAKTLPYKGNRDPKLNPNAPGKPVYYDQLRTYLMEHKRARMITGYEADDALGIYQCKEANNPKVETIICSIDKDLNMIPGRHYNFVKEFEFTVDYLGFLELSTNKKTLSGGGVMWFYAQMLLGDKSDNIPGIKGHGPVKVYDKLKDAVSEQELWEIVQQIYLDEFKNSLTQDAIYDRMYEVANLLWIWQKENDYKAVELKRMGRIDV